MFVETTKLKTWENKAFWPVLSPVPLLAVILAVILTVILAAISLKWTQHFSKGFYLVASCGKFFFTKLLLWPPISHPVMGVSSWYLHHLKTYIQGIQKNTQHLHTSTIPHTTSIWNRENIKWHIFLQIFIPAIESEMIFFWKMSRRYPHTRMVFLSEGTQKCPPPTHTRPRLTLSLF